MDDVDNRYKDSIRDALQSKNTDKLMELIPSLTEEDANYYIDSWTEKYLETMSRIRNGQDTQELDGQMHQMIWNLMDQVHLSGYHR